MPLRAEQIGLVAAKVMEDLEQHVADGDLDADAEIIAALVIYEVRSVSGESSTVGGRVTDDRNVVALGLVERMRQALINPD